MSKEYQLKDDIDGISWKNCEDLGQDYSIKGENAVFPCEGYALDVYHNVTDTPAKFKETIDKHRTLLFADSARGLNLEMTLYLPRTNWWVYVQILYEYGIQGEQVLSRAKSNIQTYRLNIYQTLSDTSAIAAAGEEVSSGPFIIFVFDCVKLALYSLYFGYQNWQDIKFLKNMSAIATGADVFRLVWNLTVMFLNIGNFILFLMLSRDADVNDLLRRNELVNSNKLSMYYYMA